MDFEGITLSETNQKEKDNTLNGFTHMWNVKKKQMNKHNKAKTKAKIPRSDQRFPEGKGVEDGSNG